MAGGFANLFAKILTNPHRNLFSVRLGVALLLGRYGITGPLADFIGVFARGFVGVLMTDGIFLIDLTLDAYREGRKLKEFEVAARRAYEKASKGLKTEAEKNALRKEYLDMLDRFGAVGSGMR